MREKNDFSLPTASRLSRVGWISRALAFRPEKKWGLLVAYRWGKMLVWQSRYLCLLNPQIPVFFLLLFQFFLVELTPTLQWIHRIYVTVFLELSNLPQVTFQNGRFSGAMLALLTRKSSIISPDTSLLKNILHAICKLLCAKFCVVTKNLSYFLSSAANDLRQIQL